MIRKSNSDTIRKISEKDSKKIGSFEDDDDDDTDISIVDDENNEKGSKEGAGGGDGDGDGDNIKADEEPTIELLKEKKKRKLLRPFNEDLLVGKDGLIRIYEDFPQKCRLNGGRGNEAQDLKRLTTMYKEWVFQLHPGMSFQDALVRSENLGSKGKVRTYLNKLRDREKCRYLVS